MAQAGAAIEQRQRAMQHQQQEAIRRQQQQIIQQQQAAYQQAVVQRQIQQQTMQQALQQRAVAQQRAYNQAVQEKVQEVYQQRQTNMQSVQQRVAEQLRAQQQAYNQAMQQAGVLMSQQFQQSNPSQISIPAVQGAAYGDLFYEPPVAEVVNITDVWQQMEANSHAWPLMIDMEPKIITVQHTIDKLRTEGISIQKPPTHYVQLIDSMAFQNPSLLDQPFEDILKVVAIIEYDFNNGQDKDALARQILKDDKAFWDNKKRLGF
ncbi:MAG TPA: hypothetical protein VI749_08705 [Candidatus Omnitrophota bacterium]|nr:hypothetical protein [Candidatus Omnitrophota bacterium]